MTPAASVLVVVVEVVVDVVVLVLVVELVVVVLVVLVVVAAADRPHVDRTAPGTMPLSASPEQPALRTAWRAWTTQRTYWPWFFQVPVQGQAAATTAATSDGQVVEWAFPFAP